jgi:hypothetical protein
MRAKCWLHAIWCCWVGMGCSSRHTPLSSAEADRAKTTVIRLQIARKLQRQGPICIGLAGEKASAPFRDPDAAMIERLKAYSDRVRPWSTCPDPAAGGDVRRKFVHITVGELRSTSSNEADLEGCERNGCYRYRLAHRAGNWTIVDMTQIAAF